MDTVTLTIARRLYYDEIIESFCQYDTLQDILPSRLLKDIKKSLAQRLKKLDESGILQDFIEYFNSENGTEIDLSDFL